jgi:DNA excision repair protein ERCC-4
MANNRHNPQLPKNKPKILVDYREKPSGLPNLLVDSGFDVTIVKLPYCDYIIDLGISIERKTGRDFVVSIIDGRLFKQASRMRKRTNRPVFLLEGSPFHVDVDIHRKAIKGAILSIQVAWCIPIIYSRSMEDTCTIFNILATQQENQTEVLELRHGFRSKRMLSKKLYLLQGLPNIGPVMALRLIKYFKTVRRVMNASMNELMEVEGIGKNTAEKIQHILR